VAKFTNHLFEQTKFRVKPRNFYVTFNKRCPSFLL